MDQRETLAGWDSYFMLSGAAESVAGLQDSPSMSPLSNTALHFQSKSNTDGSLTVLTLPLDTSSAMFTHGVDVGPHAMGQGEPVRRKRGRPRKYGHDRAVLMGLSPSFSSTPMARATQKWRGRPPGLGRNQQPSSLGESVLSGAGTMTPHIINIAVGEVCDLYSSRMPCSYRIASDIIRRILSRLQGRTGIVILSGIGSISAANIKISSSSGSIKYEGHFDMVNLSGSYINDEDGPHGPTGGVNVTFAGPDGRLIGGPVEGLLIAGSPVQVIAGSMATSTSNPKIKIAEDLEPSRDPHLSAFGNEVSPDNITQNLNPMGTWTNSR